MKTVLWFLPVLVLLGCTADDQSVERLAGATGCTPVGHTCRAVSGDRSVSLHLPADIRPLTRFPLTVGITGLQARMVTIEFTMQGMDMGVNRFGLRKNGDLWTGEAILPVCTAGRMDWVATVEVVTGEGILAADFGFDTAR